MDSSRLYANIQTHYTQASSPSDMKRVDDRIVGHEFLALNSLTPVAALMLLHALCLGSTLGILCGALGGLPLLWLLG